MRGWINLSGRDTVINVTKSKRNVNRRKKTPDVTNRRQLDHSCTRGLHVPSGMSGDKQISVSRYQEGVYYVLALL